MTRQESKKALEDEMQQAQYDRIEKVLGSETLAHFCCCALFNVPFVMKSMAKAETDSKWIAYKQKLRKQYLVNKGFHGGTTSALKIFGEDAEPEEVAILINDERAKNPVFLEIGTKTQVQNWGTGSEDDPFKKEDYDRLDDIFATMSDRLISSGGMDVQQEDTLRQTAIMRLMRDKFVLAGDRESIAKAAQLDKMIKENLSSEQLRKADAKPIEDLRIDSIVDALEKWGAVENGKLLPFQDLTEFLLKQLGRLGGTPAHKYTQTLDAADYELWFIRQCMAQNEDLPQWAEMPDSLRFPEEVAAEFSETPSDDEERAYSGIGIVRSRGKTNASEENGASLGQRNGLGPEEGDGRQKLQ